MVVAPPIAAMGLDMKSIKTSSVLFFFLGGLGEVTCLAQIVDFKPKWSGMSTIELNSNQSYLADTFLKTQLNNDVLDYSQTLDLRQRFEDLNRDYEMRQKFGLVCHELEINHTGQVSDFSKKVAQQVKSRQMIIEKKKFMPFVDSLRKTEILRAVEKPAGFLVGAVAIYFGEPIRVHLSQEVKISAKAVVPSRTGSLVVNSPYLNGVLDVRASAPLGRDPASVSPPDAMGRGDERFRVVLSQVLPWIGVSSGWSYVSTSNLFGASFNKQITPHLSCSFDYYFPLDPLTTDVKIPGENVKLSYGMNF